MAKIIVVSNQKGGVGKTFTSSMLAYLLSSDSNEKVAASQQRAAEKVLLIDTDFQGDSSFLLTRVDRDDFVGKDLMAAMLKEDATDYVVKVSEHLDVLPASEELAKFDSWFERNAYNIEDPFKILERTLAPIASNYDWIIVDTSPALTKLKNQAMSISFGNRTNMLIPLQTDRFGFDSVLQFSNTLQAAKEHMNPNLYLMGILPILADAHMSLDQKIIAEARETFEDLLFNTVIKRRAVLKEMVEHGISEHYAKQRAALVDFYDLVKEVRQHAK